MPIYICNPSDRMYYYIRDYQGNVRQVTDADGAVVQDNHYYPYGMLMGESSNIIARARGYYDVSFNPYLYGSKEYLTTSGANLLDFHARVYDPATLFFQKVKKIKANRMKIQYRLFLGILLLSAINQNAASKLNHEKVSVVEINVLDYPFMKEIADFIRQTDQDKLFPQYDKPRYEAEYSFNIDCGNFSKASNKSFYANGTYSICVSLSPCVEQYLFIVNGVRFYSDDDLIPYFDSCKLKKVIKEAFKNDEAFWYYFWFFEVRDGKVIDAVYFYEPVDDGFDKYDIYDLIHKEYIPYKEWRSKIHPEK